MKPYLEARNKRIREEYSRRKKHESPEDLFDEFGEREHLSPNTVRVICQTEKYGSYHKTLKVKLTPTL